MGESKPGQCGRYKSPASTLCNWRQGCVEMETVHAGGREAHRRVRRCTGERR